MYVDGHAGDLRAAEMVDGRGPRPDGSSECKQRQRFRNLLWYDMSKWYPGGLRSGSSVCGGDTHEGGTDCYEEP